MKSCAAVFLCALGVLAAAGCGSAWRPPRRPHAAADPARPLSGPALGITEDNANLLRAPALPAPGAFAQARAELAALHPQYVRLLIDWAALQPSPAHAPQLSAEVDGCDRGVAPCGAYRGVRDELAAIASQQRIDPGGFEVLIDVFGVPAWAAAQPHGCELPGSPAFARALAPAAIAGYERLVSALLALGREEGVRLRWWSPWNEPNDPRFLSPQRGECSASSAPLSAQVYAQLALAMANVLGVEGARHELVLGELQGLTVDSPRTTSISQFVAALPEEVACLSAVWSVHAYASYGESSPAAGEPLRALEGALDARGGCAAGAQVWVTEAGEGAPHAGQARPLGASAERAGCEAFAAQLARWSQDPRVGAVFQYTFREDPDFQVGLASPDLGHLFSSYGLLLHYARAREGDGSAYEPSACA